MSDRRTRWDESLVFPEQWIADGYAYRKAKGFSRINVRLEAERFVNHALAHGSKYVKWHKAWLFWLTNGLCKGEPEVEPVRLDAKDELSIRRVKAALAYKARSAYFDIQDVRRALELGAITAEEARRLGA